VCATRYTCPGVSWAQRAHSCISYVSVPRSCMHATWERTGAVETSFSSLNYLDFYLSMFWNPAACNMAYMYYVCMLQRCLVPVSTCYFQKMFFSTQAQEGMTRNQRLAKRWSNSVANVNRHPNNVLCAQVHWSWLHHRNNEYSMFYLLAYIQSASQSSAV